MNTRTLILIVILGVVTIGLVSLAVLAQRQRQAATTQNTQQPVVTEEPLQQTVILSLTKSNTSTRPAVGTSSAIPSAPVTIMINAGENKVMGAQIELSYDPKALTDVKVTPPTDNSFFGPSSSYIVFDNTVKQTEGRISYVIAMTPTSTAKTGTGSLGTITFTKKGTGSTTLSFLDKTNVQQPGNITSVLKEAQSLTIE